MLPSANLGGGGARMLSWMHSTQAQSKPRVRRYHVSMTDNESVAL
jgi:hypothetical protein